MRDDFEARYKLEVSDIERGNIETEVQGRVADYEVLERYGYAPSALLCFDASNESGYFDGNSDLYLFKDLPDGMPSALRSDYDAGVKN